MAWAKGFQLAALIRVLLLLPFLGNAGHAKPARPAAALAMRTTSTLRAGTLATWEMRLVGLRLKVPAELEVPSGTPFLVKTSLWFGNREASTKEVGSLVPSGAECVGTLTGPDLPVAGVVVKGTPQVGLSMPPLTKAGNYTLADIHLQDGTRKLLDAEPRTMQIRCLGEILITQVTSDPMTKDEILAAGLKLGPGSYDTQKFTFAMVMGGQKIELKVPVATPGVGTTLGEEPIIGIPQLVGLNYVPDLSVAVVNLIPEKDSDTFYLSRPSVSQTLRHSFKALIVIPGSLGYLKQFYKVNLLVFNTLKPGSPYKVTHLKATLKVPPGENGEVGTGEDDPLLIVAKDGESNLATKSILGPDSNDKPGAGVDELLGGQTGMATYFVEALRVGAHALDFDIKGQFEGDGLGSPVPLVGHAQGKILVRNPSFNMVLVHPDVVRKGEVYTLEVRVTNTSTSLVNDVSISLDQARLGGVKLVSEASQSVKTLQPGEVASLKFQLRAMRNGEVQSSYLYTQGNNSSSFQLTTGLGERNIRLNPDTLVLPQTLDVLPEDLREAILRVLGQAYSIATTKGTLPPGVIPIPMSVVTGKMAAALSEQGLFLRMGVDKARVWKELWNLFTRNEDPGVDQLMRTTEAGANLRNAFLGAWTSWAGGGTPLSDRIANLATWGEKDPMPVWVAIDGAAPGLNLFLFDALGRGIATPSQLPILELPGSAWGTAQGTHLLQLPLTYPGAKLLISNAESNSQKIRMGTVSPLVQGVPSSNTYEIELLPGWGASITFGVDRTPVIDLLQPGHPTLQFRSTNTQDVSPEPFKVLAVHRYDLEIDSEATPFGTHVMVLFNKPNTPVDIKNGPEGFEAANALISVDGNQFWQKDMTSQTSETGSTPLSPAALIQAFPRIVSCYLERPLGPYVQRYLTLASTWKDTTGASIGGDLRWPILSGSVPGGAVVSGKVRKATGDGVPSKLSYWYRYIVAPDAPPAYVLVTNNLATGPDGSFQLDYVPEPVAKAVGPFLLEGVSTQGKAIGMASVLGNGQRLEMDLVLEGEGSVEGQVLDALGQPVANAFLIATQQRGSKYTELPASSDLIQTATYTDLLGKFRFDKMKVGPVTLRAQKGLLSTAANYEIPAEGAVVRADLVLKSPSGKLRVQLLDLGGKGMPDHTIGLGPASTGMYFWGVKTDANGWAQFNDAPAGDLRLRVLDLPSTMVSEWQGYLQSGSEQSVTLRVLPVEEKAQISYEVVDSLANPVSGAYLSDYRGTFAVTDEDGRAPAQAIPAGRNYVVVANHSKWVEPGQSATYVPKVGEVLTIRVTMPPRGAVEGQVTWTDGTPVKGAYVAIPPVWVDASLNRLAITDAKGNYRISNAKVGESVRIAVVGPELRTALNRQIQVKKEETLHLDFQLPRAARNELKGTAYQPLEGTQPQSTMAHVWVTGKLPSVNVPAAGNPYCNPIWGLDEEVLLGDANTVEDGKFLFKDIPSGAYTLRATANLFPVVAVKTGEFSEATRDVPESRTQDIYLNNTFAGEVRGTVYQKDGQTTVGTGLRVRLIDTLPVTANGIGELIVQTQAGGKYVFSKVIPEGNYLLRPEDPNTGNFSVIRLQLFKQATTTKDLRLWGKGSVTIHFQDSFGKPLPEGEVTLSHSKEGESSGAIKLLEPNDLPGMVGKLEPVHQGILVFDDLIEGLISIRVKTPGGLVGVGTTEILQGGGDQDVIVRLQPVGSIRGLLRRADGTAVPAGRVDAAIGDKWLGVSTTRIDGVDGRFFFQSLPEGTIRLEAWDPDKRQKGVKSVEVRGGETTEVDLQTWDTGQVDVLVTQDSRAKEGIRLALSGKDGSAMNFRAEAVTDIGGKSRFFVPPGNYQVEATDPVTLTKGVATFTRTLDQAAFSVALNLQPVRNLRVVVAPPSGLESAQIMGWKLITQLGRIAFLDANGGCLLQDLPVGSHTATLYDLAGRSRGAFTLVVTEAGGDTQFTQVQAIARGRVKVTLQEYGGSPYVGGQIRLWTSNGERFEQPTNDQGIAILEGIPQGIQSVGGVSREGRRQASGNVILSKEDATAELGLTLPPVGGLTGLLKDESGQVLTFTRVGLSVPNVWSTTLATDAQGRFGADLLPMGTYQLEATAEDGVRAGTVKVVLSEPNVTVNADLTLKGKGAVMVKVWGPTGVPLANQPISLTNTSGFFGAKTLTGNTDNLGQIRFPAVLEGPQRASTNFGGKGYETPGLLTAGGSLTLELRIKATTSITGRIRRAGADQRWPDGTSANIVVGNYSRYYPLGSDGTITDAYGQIDIGNGQGTATVSMPNSRTMSIGFFDMTSNAPTVLDLIAPAFGSLSGNLQNSDGTPAVSAAISLDGQTVTYTNAAGNWSWNGVTGGAHHVVASSSKGYGIGDMTLAYTDGATATLNLKLQSNAVTLGVSLRNDNTGFYGYVDPTGFSSFGSSRVTPYLSVDGRAEVIPKPLDRIAYWIEPNRQIRYITTIGSLEVTSTRTISAQPYFLRDEIQIRNTDTVPHRVSLRHLALMGYDMVGIPSSNSSPVLIGEGRDLGIVGTYGTLLWGNGTDSPKAVNVINDYTRSIQWPEWTLGPGEQKTLALAEGQYGKGDGAAAVNNTYGFRNLGIPAMVNRILQGAPEWQYLGTPSAWTNWKEFQTPLAVPLREWNASAKLTVLDFLGRPVVNYFYPTFEPTEPLARVVNMNGNILTLQNQPPNGGKVSFDIEGVSPQLRLERILDLTQDSALRLEEAAPVIVDLKDAHGNPVSGANVYFRANGYWRRGSTNAGGSYGPLLVTPSVYPVEAELPNSYGFVKVSGEIQAQAGVDNRISLTFPSVGSLQVTVIDLDGLPSKRYIYAGIKKDSMNWSQYTSTGSIRWDNLLPGNWTLSISDPYTGGTLTQVVNVTADGVASATFRLRASSRVEVTVLDPLGANAGSSKQVSIVATDGAKPSAYTDAMGLAKFPYVAAGRTRITAYDYNKSLSNTIYVDLAEGGTLQATIQLGSGNLNVSLKSIDGRPLPSKSFSVNWEGGGTSRYTDATGALSFTGLPLNQPLTLRQSGYNGGPLYPTVPDQAFTLTQNGETQNMAFTLPVGQLKVKVLRDSLPVQGVTVSLGMAGATQALSGYTDAQGIAIFPEVPLNVTLNYTLQKGGNIAKGIFTYAGPDESLELVMPPITSYSVHLRRANGQVPLIPPGGSSSISWEWTASPAGETSNPQKVTDAVWADLPANVPVTFTSSLSLFQSLAYNYPASPNAWWSRSANAWWRASGTTTPSDTNREMTINLPVLASAKLRFQDSKGQPMAGGLTGDSIKIHVVNSTNPAWAGNAYYHAYYIDLTISSLDPYALAEVFTEGTHTLSFTSSRWGDLGTATLTVGAQDDGKVLDFPVTLPWVQTSYRLRALAGDRKTPVGSVQMEALLKDAWVSAGSVYNEQGDIDDERWFVKGTLWAPQGQPLRFRARFTESMNQDYLKNQDYLIEGATHPAGEMVDETLILPITALRCQLVDQDGVTPAVNPQVRLLGTGTDGWSRYLSTWTDGSGVRWFLLFGKVPFSKQSIIAYEYSSGLGQAQSVEVQSIGQVQEVKFQLPAYTWVSASLPTTGTGVTYSNFEIGLPRNTPGLLDPRRATTWYSTTVGEGPDAKFVAGPLKVPVAATSLWWGASERNATDYGYKYDHKPLPVLKTGETQELPLDPPQLKATRFYLNFVSATGQGLPNFASGSYILDLEGGPSPVGFLSDGDGGPYSILYSVQRFDLVQGVPFTMKVKVQTYGGQTLVGQLQGNLSQDETTLTMVLKAPVAGLMGSETSESPALPAKPRSETEATDDPDAESEFFIPVPLGNTGQTIRVLVKEKVENAPPKKGRTSKSQPASR